MADVPTLLGLIGRFRRFGAAPAIIVVGDQAKVTAVSFEQLSNAALALVHALAESGVGKGMRIAIAGPNSPGWVACFWGIVAAGAVAVPLDPHSDDAALARAIECAGCGLAFLTPSRTESLRRLLPGCDVRPLVTELRTAAPSASMLPTVAGGDTAVIVFTSGTTGAPKAVPLSHRNLLSNVEALLAEGVVASGDCAMLPLPLHHIYPLTVGMLTPLAAGIAIVLTENLSGPQLVSALKSSAATILVGVPRLYAALDASIRARLPRPAAAVLAASGWLRRNVGVDLGSALFLGVRAQIGPKLHLLVCGGAALDREVEERLIDLGWEVLTGYGLSETSPILTFNRRSEAHVGSAGQPLPGTQIRISAPDADGVGEIEARGPGVFAGYLGDEAVSRTAFTDDGWFRTGDLGRLDGQGYLHIVARGSETIVLSSGKKVFPEDVETAYASVPNVKEMAVLARGGDIVALVVPDFDALRARGATRLVDVIRDALANRAATLPGHFRLTGFTIAREPLPRTQIGKLRRHLLPDLYARISEARPAMQPPVLDAADRALLSDPVAASVWEWLQVRYRGTPINLDTSPQLDLGIDSLGWIDVTLSLQRSLRIELTDAAIARIVTLRDLLREAAAARSEVSATESPAVASPPPSDGPFVAALHYLFYIVIRCLMRLAYGVRSEGVDRLPDEPFILCPNHTSFLDPFAVAAALPYRRVRRLRWGGWTGQLFGTPARRTFSRIVRVLPIDPDRAAASSLALATGVLSAGHDLVWFAEGERSRDGGLTRFRPGIGVLVERTHAPVVPVCIEGAFTAWPRGRTCPRFGRISVRFGDPQKPDVILGTAHGADRHQNIADHVRDTVARLSRREAA